ncbi:unnamed protein product [Dicrocoelium dendriticum]|nr:unnamed protein product [Dicrocoelium dendriticum]
METPFPSEAVPILPSSLEHVEMSADVVSKGIRELDPNSSPSPDGLHPLFPKTVVDYIAAPVCRHGFRRSRSWFSNLLVARERWAKSLDAGKRLDVIFVDFSKAFNKVPHERLLHKLRLIGVSWNVLSWIADFLDDQTMRVDVNETYSVPVLMTSGVPQGSVLGPEPFKITGSLDDREQKEIPLSAPSLPNRFGDSLDHCGTRSHREPLKLH